MKKYFSDTSFLVGVILTVFMFSVALVSCFWLPYDTETMDFSAKLSLPCAAHILGCDKFGRDTASRLMKGIRTSFTIGLFVVAAGGAAGTLLGAVSGYFGKWADSLIMKLVDAQMAFPGILLALMLIAVFGSGTGNTILALSIMALPRFVRISRSGYMRLREADFVRAEKIRGASSARIMFCHILPNLYPELAATASLTFASAVMSEAGLSYLGLGIVPPEPSLGSMLSEAQEVLLKSPWSVLIPAAAIACMVLGFNLLGDGIQQVSEQ